VITPDRRTEHRLRLLDKLLDRALPPRRRRARTAPDATADLPNWRRTLGAEIRRPGALSGRKCPSPSAPCRERPARPRPTTARPDGGALGNRRLFALGGLLSPCAGLLQPPDITSRRKLASSRRESISSRRREITARRARALSRRELTFPRRALAAPDKSWSPPDERSPPVRQSDGALDRHPVLDPAARGRPAGCRTACRDSRSTINPT